jgi:hypothetical protein
MDNNLFGSQPRILDPIAPMLSRKHTSVILLVVQRTSKFVFGLRKKIAIGCDRNQR